MINITIDLVRKLILEQFPEYSSLPITSVEKQGHDNRTYRLGEGLLIRMPTAESYALKVPKEQELLPKIAPHLSVNISMPIKMGDPSEDYPYQFSIYKWLDGKSANFLHINDQVLEYIALELANFLKELHSINNIEGPGPGQHNWWRGGCVDVYDKGARAQITNLADMLDTNKAMDLWVKACSTKWSNPPVWIHGDFASGNMLIKDNKLSGIIDFGGMGVGDPACDLVIAWTFLKGKSREIFKEAMKLDDDTWMRARGWALWKATFELCNIMDKNSLDATKQIKIIEDVLAQC